MCTEQNTTRRSQFASTCMQFPVRDTRMLCAFNVRQSETFYYYHHIFRETAARHLLDPTPTLFPAPPHPLLETLRIDTWNAPDPNRFPLPCLSPCSFSYRWSIQHVEAEARQGRPIFVCVYICIRSLCLCMCPRVEVRIIPGQGRSE